MVMDRFTECADVRSSAGSASQQLRCGKRRFLRIVFRADAMPAALLPDMFAEKLMRFRIENADVKRIRLNVDKLSDPARRNAVIGRVYFDTSIQMHGAFAVLVVTEGFQR